MSILTKQEVHGIIVGRVDDVLSRRRNDSMKKLFVTLATVAAYLFISIFTGWWAVTWIIWVFYFVYIVYLVYQDHQ